MKEKPNYFPIKDYVESCLNLDLSNDKIIQDPCSLFFLDAVHFQDARKISIERQYPSLITEINIQVIPQKDLIYLFSIDGVEDIVTALFSNISSDLKEELLSIDLLIKVFLDTDPIYNFPVLNISVFFLGKITSDGWGKINENLKNEVFPLCHSKGKIWDLQVNSVEELIRILKVPLKLSIGSLDSQNIPSNFFLNPVQLQELNQFFLLRLQKIDLEEFLDVGELWLDSHLIHPYHFNPDLEKSWEDEFEELIKKPF